MKKEINKMEKVKINQTVANWIENAKSLYNFQAVDSLLMWRVLENIRSEQMIEDEIDIVTLAKAIQYGYEVEYEFKVGDILYSHFSNRFVEITASINDYKKELSISSLLENIREGKKYDLVCKAEERYDLK
jgi:hypothetical protein